MEHLLLQPLFLVTPRDVSEKRVQSEIYRVGFPFLEPMPCHALYEGISHVRHINSRVALVSNSDILPRY